MILTIFSFIFVIGVLVFFHEMGHFLAAKSVGVRVEKFYLGFNFFGLGWKKMYKGTEYGIGLFPLGGYVKLAGIIDESMDTEYTGAPDEFKSKNMFQKIWIMSAGVLMNFLLAILIFTHLTYHNGINEADPRAIVGQVLEEYPAEYLGLQAGDEIFSINGVQVSDWEEMTAEIHQYPNEKLQLNWLRDGKMLTGDLTTESVPQFIGDEIVQKGMIGIQPIYDHYNVTISKALYYGCQRTYQFSDIIIRTIKGLLKGNISIKELGGKIYLAGDGAIRDRKTGYFTIMGRIDDVLNVSGHRLGTMEIESALVANQIVTEAAVVGKPHDIKGESIVAFVVLKGSRPTKENAETIINNLKQWVSKEIGPIARPDEIRFGDNLPKTRSGKIMRRLLRSLAKGEEITSDISTLENPAILDQLGETL